VPIAPLRFKYHMIINRREFIQCSTAAVALGLTANANANAMPKEKTIRIKDVSSNFEREPLNPYLFKGSAITESCKPSDCLKTPFEALYQGYISPW